MALISCPECGRQVSTLAQSCPGCGAPLAATGQPPALGGIVTPGLLGKLSVVLGLVSVSHWIARVLMLLIAAIIIIVTSIYKG